MIQQNDFFRVLLLMKERLAGYFMVLFPYALLEVLCQNMVMAIVMRDALNAGFTGDDSLVWRALLTALVAFFVGQPLYWLLNYMSNAYIIKTMTEVQSAAFSRTLHLPIPRFEQEHSGSMLTRLTDNMDSINLIYERLLPVVVFHFTYTSLALGFVFYFDWRMGLVVLVLSLGNIVIGRAFEKPMQAAGDRYQEQLSSWTAIVLDIIQSAMVTRLFNLYEWNGNRHHKKSNTLKQELIHQGDLGNLSEGIHSLYSNLRYIILLGIGLTLVMSGRLDLGSVGAFLFMPNWASLFFESIGRVISRGQEFLAGARRVFDLHDWEPEEISESEKAISEPVSFAGSEAVALQGVSFRYEQTQPGQAALDQVSLVIQPGKTAALIGSMGSGKSTLIKLLLGFYPLQDGEILIAGKPMHSYRLVELRNQFAYVPQDAHLFAGTIEENIRYGKPGASRDEIVQAARLARAHDFISARPQGYATLIGEQGGSLSGGERQRIAIARAILKDAPILLLDEATSALDSESEKLVQEGLGALMFGRTTIAIAHRLSTITDADHIFVFEKGRVIEDGTHATLIEKNGTYQRLFHLQAGAL